jgi:hypothetical protein
VNNWHWQEKDAFEWARERFNALLVLAVAGTPDGDGTFLKTTGVTTLTGEAYVNRRKGKIIAGQGWHSSPGWRCSSPRYFAQLEHQLMTAGVVHVTNRTHPGDTREWQP